MKVKNYMAIIRNLRNILQAGVSQEHLDKVCLALSDEYAVKHNKLLPFRYYSAYKVLTQEGLATSKVLDALEKAIKISTQNINKLSGKTLIAADVSGSMTSAKPSSKSDITCAEIATLMLAMANYIAEDAYSVSFDTALYKCSLPTSNGIISNAKSMRVNGGGTDITLPIKWLLETQTFVDRIIMLSDNEINSGWVNGRSSWYGRSSTVPCQTLIEEYKRKVNPNVWVHAIDLEGYGTQQFKGKNVNIIAGWSEKTFEFIDMVEKGADNLVKTIEGYYFK